MNMNAEARAVATRNDPRWARVLHRDRSADGTFFYSVRTTRVYCRPSCAARPARPENVEFHMTTAAAEHAGFRPCKRCKPNQAPAAIQHAVQIAELCRWIEQAESFPSLAALARHAGTSPYHLHRRFKAVTGLTPKAYAMAHRAKQVRRALGEGRTITDALYDAGFNSNGRFYATSGGVLGMTPTAFRQGGLDTTIQFAIDHCSLGAILVAATERGVCAIFMADDRKTLRGDLQDRFPRAVLVEGDAGFQQQVAKVIAMVEAPRLGLDLPLDVRGTAFQQRVWQALRAIPAGEKKSYAAIAKDIGAPKAVRAVAQACAANALAVAIPCHRVVRSDGSLSGYRWGPERKQALLEREADEEGTLSRPSPRRP
ncbi:MAG: bifunctional DNA-binding transcriptional regulator/O6-methylguanine-DNA methyltransferase Ada [Betaproteobacteria bacterium]|nr:bifunctional DNA-binding transcriptional regulator/O6-methylguanine-DNA methyltransferase Ada [Betaproteobacteria bacterium]